MDDRQRELIARYEWYGSHLAWLGYDVLFEKSRADLSGANLRRADLSGADLSGVNLRGADLSGANLSDAEGNFSLFYAGKHHAIATCSHIHIGCERHTHTEWRENFHTIGNSHGYTYDEIERYRQWIFSLDWLIE